MQTPNERLKLMRERRGFETAYDAARAYGWNANTYSSHENGSRGIPPDAAIKYAAAYSFTLDWLYTGKAHAKNRGLALVKDGGIGEIPNIAYKRLPRLSWDFMKNYGGLELAMERATEFSSLPQHMRITMPAFSMKVEGDSMRNPTGTGPSFSPGDELIFSIREPIRPGDFVLAEILDENTVVFRQYRERGRNNEGFMTFELAPLNPAYETRMVTASAQARLVAKMTHRIESFL
jgi:hypothetical protein